METKERTWRRRRTPPRASCGCGARCGGRWWPTAWRPSAAASPPRPPPPPSGWSSWAPSHAPTPLVLVATDYPSRISSPLASLDQKTLERRAGEAAGHTSRPEEKLASPWAAGWWNGLSGLSDNVLRLFHVQAHPPALCFGRAVAVRYPWPMGDHPLRQASARAMPVSICCSLAASDP